MRWDGGKWVSVPISMVLIQGGRCHDHQGDIWRSVIGFRWGVWGDGGGVRQMALFAMGREGDECEALYLDQGWPTGNSGRQLGIGQ